MLAPSLRASCDLTDTLMAHWWTARDIGHIFAKESGSEAAMDADVDFRAKRGAGAAPADPYAAAIRIGLVLEI